MPEFVDLEAAIFELIEKLGGKARVIRGIVKVDMPDGSVWDFTTPVRVSSEPEKDWSYSGQTL